MIGAVIGDIAGSRFEFNNLRSKHGYSLLDKGCFFTDDTVMTLAIADACIALRPGEKLADLSVKKMREIGQNYPHCGYGGRFLKWMYSKDHRPYNSYGNGAAMRVSPVSYFAKDLSEAIWMAEEVTAVTHDHPEAIKAASTVAACVWGAIHGWSKEELSAYVRENYHPLDFTLDEIRDSYEFNETCMETVPQALEAFFEATDFEDAIRNAISIGGDSDTIACITGSIAGPYFGVPVSLQRKTESFLDRRLNRILHRVMSYCT